MEIEPMRWQNQVSRTAAAIYPRAAAAADTTTTTAAAAPPPYIDVQDIAWPMSPGS